MYSVLDDDVRCERSRSVGEVNGDSCSCHEAVSLVQQKTRRSKSSREKARSDPRFASAARKKGRISKLGTYDLRFPREYDKQEQEEREQQVVQLQPFDRTRPISIER